MSEMDFDFSEVIEEERANEAIQAFTFDPEATVVSLRNQVANLESEVQFWRDMRKVNRLIENAEALSAASRKCMEEAEKLRQKLLPLIEKYDGGLEL
jgi:hypothetical protein